jgi:hypothetical protein
MWKVYTPYLRIRFFLVNLIRNEKRNNFVEENFSIQASFHRENSIWKFNKNGRSFFFPLYFLMLSYEKIEREEGTSVFVEFPN